MKNFFGTVALVLFAGCLDFDQGQKACVEAGNCLGTLTPVTITSSSPANQATNVAASSLLAITFSREMDTGSVKVVIAPAVALNGLMWEADNLSFTVQSTSALAYSTQYSVTVTGRSKDGVALGDDAAFTFTTEKEPDKVPPTLSATSPQSGTPNVPVDFKVVLTFSEAMAQSTVSLTSQPPFLFGTPSWSGDGQTATFDMPLDTFAPKTDYVVQIDGKDLAGNALTGIKTLTFKTATPPDTTPPQVVGTSPAQGAIGISVTTSPSVSFSEPMNASTVSTSFTVSPAIPGGCSILPDANGMLFTCNHGQALAASTTYTVTIGTGAKDGAGNALAAAFTFSFTTGIVPDTTPPTINSTVPLTNAAGTTQSPTITVNFSEPMDQGLTQAAFSIAQPAGWPFANGTFSWDAGTQLNYSFPPGYKLSYGQNVVWQVGTGAKDLAGNALASLQSFSFKVRQQKSVDLYADSTGSFNDGWWDQIAVYSANNTTELRVGDDYATNTTPNAREVRALVSFNLAAPNLPATALEVLSATLTMRQTGTAGSPYSGYRGVNVFGIDPTVAFGYTAFSTPALCFGFSCGLTVQCVGKTLTTGSIAGDYSAVVDGFARAGFTNAAKRVSFRLQRVDITPMIVGCPTVGTNGDTVKDYAAFAASESSVGRPKLTVVYTDP